MRERPILFSGPMVRAILEGRKTQTRRVVKVRGLEFIGGMGDENDPAGWGYEWPDRDGYATLADGIPCPYGQPGDRLWVRETWAHRRWMIGDPSASPTSAYRADGEDLKQCDRWRRSIHMPRHLSRILLEVIDVRVERVQNISSSDAYAEGVSVKYPDGCDPIVDFANIWDSINAKRGYRWDANPWVWVVSFKRIEP